MKESLQKYLDYEQSDEEFYFAMRMAGFIWYEERYQIMLSLVNNVLKDYRYEEKMPEAIVSFFEHELPRIVGTISNPIFLRNPPAPFSEQQYWALIETRKDELMAMQQFFFQKKYDEILSYPITPVSGIMDGFPIGQS